MMIKHRLSSPPVHVRAAGTGWRVKKAAGANHIECSLLKELIIFIEPVPRNKIELLMNKYPHQEWLGYLVGRQSELGNFFVEDLVIPPHAEAFAGSAEAEPFYQPDNCLGVIHSHHTMGAFHSGTDDSHVDRNFPISVTVAKRAQGNIEYDAISHRTTECGKETTIKGTVKYVAPAPTFDTEAFVKDAEANIDKGKRPLYTYHPVVTLNPYQYNQGGYINGGGGVMTEKEYNAAIKEIFSDE